MAQPADFQDPDQLFEVDDCVETFRDLVTAIKQKRFSAAVAPRRTLKRQFGFDILYFPPKHRRAGEREAVRQ